MITGSDQWKKIIVDGAKTLGLDVEDDQLEKFSLYALELEKWNRKINITAIKDPLEIAIKHFLDSMALLPFAGKTRNLLDMGSGGGFPGIPIKIMDPSVKVTLVDSARKRVNFMSHIIRTLGLEAIETIHARGEELIEKDGFVSGFDMVTCRAFTELGKFVTMAMPYASEGGYIVAMKGKDGEKELAAMKDKSFKCGDKTVGIDDFHIETFAFELPFVQSQRVIIKMNLK